MVNKPIGVLMVDDDPGICSLTKEFLERFDGVNVDTYHSVEDARTALARRRYDVIICDYQMPGEDGISFLRSLRCNGDATPFMLFTGKGREEIVIDALNSGADAYMQKSAHPSSLYTEMHHRINVLVERARANEIMREGECVFRTLVNQTKEALYLHELTGSIIEVNERAVRDSGYSRDELLGMSVFDIDPTLENLPDRETIWKNMELDKYLTFNGFHKKKDGCLYPIEVRIARIQIGGMEYVLSLAEDVTMRRFAEGEIEKEMKKFLSCLYTAKNGMFICDQDGTCLDVNEVMCAITRYSRSDLISRSILELLSPKEREMIVRHLRIARHEGRTRVDLSLKRGDGTIRSYSIDLVRMTPERYLGFIEDLPEAPVGVADLIVP